MHHWVVDFQLRQVAQQPFHIGFLARATAAHQVRLGIQLRLCDERQPGLRQHKPGMQRRNRQH